MKKTFTKYQRKLRTAQLKREGFDAIKKLYFSRNYFYEKLEDIKFALKAGYDELAEILKKDLIARGDQSETTINTMLYGKDAMTASHESVELSMMYEDKIEKL